VLHGRDSKGDELALHLLAFLVIAAPRVVVIPTDGPHDAAIEATIVDGARAAGLEVVSLKSAKEIEKLVTCSRRELDCLLRMAALGDVDGAIAWRKSAPGAVGAVDVVVVSVERKRDARGPIADVTALARSAFDPPVEAPPPVHTPPPPNVGEPPATVADPPPPSPPATTPTAPPPVVTATEPALDVVALSLTAGGGVVALACGVGAVVLDAGLSSDVERATQRIAPRPDDFELRQGLFFGALVGAGVGVVGAGVGAVLLATE
jgi:hypothetical protein